MKKNRFSIWNILMYMITVSPLYTSAIYAASVINDTGVNFTESDLKRSENYWTLEKMKLAKSDDKYLDKLDSSLNTQQDTVKTTENSKKWIGTLFFTRGGRDGSCTASSIVSDSKSVIATAAHCLYQGGNWATNLRFVPQWDGANKPLLTWGALDYQIPRDWRYTESPAHDAAFVKIQSRLDWNGKIHRLGDPDQASATPVQFSFAKPLLHYITAGYKTSVLGGNYDNLPLNVCSGVGLIKNNQNNKPTGDLAIRGCGAEPGSSGGPVYHLSNKGLSGTQVGVISQTGVSGITPLLIFVPWGDTEYSLYKAVDKYPF